MLGMHHSDMHKLRQAREAARLTQMDLANRTGMSQSWLSRAERGDVPMTLEALRLLAPAMGLEWYEVLGYTHPPDADLSDLTRDLVRLSLRLNAQAQRLLLTQAMAYEGEGMTSACGSERPPPRT